MLLMRTLRVGSIVEPAPDETWEPRKRAHICVNSRNFLQRSQRRTLGLSSDNSMKHETKNQVIGAEWIDGGVVITFADEKEAMYSGELLRSVFDRAHEMTLEESLQP